MLHAALGFEGAFSAPHRAAALAGRDILRQGGTAMEAMVAAAATIAVVYPHMNGIGGDGFWLIRRHDGSVTGISACGQAAGLATPEWYAERGHTKAMPTRGGHAALTVPGTLGGWAKALDLVEADLRFGLDELLDAAISYARDGIAVTGNQSVCTADKLAGLKDVPGFAETFLLDGEVPAAGQRLKQRALGRTLKLIATEGIESFYSGELAATHAAFLEDHGSPLRYEDFTAYAAREVEPLKVGTSHGVLMNMIPPTQGIASLMILALFDRLAVEQGEGFDHVHGLIEATKQAFILRNAGLGDPDFMTEPAQNWLDGERLDALAEKIHRSRALAWPYDPAEGDTIWMGAADRYGNVVSFIQSVYWEFGSGLTCPETGVYFQNRGAGFSLKPGPNLLAPGKRPFHTLNPAMALLRDGRVMAYGTMGGEGQPQTQSAVFTRHIVYGMDLQQAITAPRWLLGRTWGEETTTLKLEDRFDPALVQALKDAGHDVEMIAPFSDTAGHAGAVVLHPGGLMEAATDPRADGAAIVD
ncbi:gamma-glutamyltransferase family protein [Martelella alba]|uniref:Gamma-glutamyltransferase family protein n=1 Tax=Martelella alba TaxID=2590451 RepID=A0A506U823_9HYPH|nr:gamma-glutamyltransferase family protein [Martelella alba]TPW30493.1 gamma-glutamyltransferase family protein [Martelella alba]